MVTVLEGTGRFTVGGAAHTLTQGQSLVMPAQVPHAVVRAGAVQDAADRGVLRRFWADGR